MFSPISISLTNKTLLKKSVTPLKFKANPGERPSQEAGQHPPTPLPPPTERFESGQGQVRNNLSPPNNPQIISLEEAAGLWRNGGINNPSGTPVNTPLAPDGGVPTHLVHPAINPFLSQLAAFNQRSNNHPEIGATLDFLSPAREPGHNPQNGTTHESDSQTLRQERVNHFTNILIRNEATNGQRYEILMNDLREIQRNPQHPLNMSIQEARDSAAAIGASQEQIDLDVHATFIIYILAFLSGLNP